MKTNKCLNCSAMSPPVRQHKTTSRDTLEQFKPFQCIGCPCAEKRRTCYLPAGFCTRQVQCPLARHISIKDGKAFFSKAPFFSCPLQQSSAECLYRPPFREVPSSVIQYGGGIRYKNLGPNGRIKSPVTQGCHLF